MLCSLPTLWGKRKLFQALWYTGSCSVPAYFRSLVLLKMRPSFFLSSPSCVRTRFVTSHGCYHHDRKAAGLKGFAVAGCSSEPQGSPGCMASPGRCPSALSAGGKKAADHSSFYKELMAFCLWGFVCMGRSTKGRTPDSRLKSEFHLACIFFSKNHQCTFMWKQEGLCGNSGLKQLQRTGTVVWLKCNFIRP